MYTSTAPGVRSRKWYEIWWDVWSIPGVQTFKTIQLEKDHAATRGLMWVGGSTLFVYLLSTGISIISLGFQLPQFPQVSQLVSYTVFSSVFGILIYPFIATISIGGLTWIIHLFAKVFGGKGDLGNLTICFAAVYCPSAILGSLMGMVTTLLARLLGLVDFSFDVPHLTGITAPQIPFQFFVIAVISLVFSLYAFVLVVMAVSATEDIGFAGAIGTLILPIVVLIGAAFCVFNYVLPAFIYTF